LPGAPERALGRVIPRLWADWSPGYDASEDLPLVFAAFDTPARRTAALRYYRAVLAPWQRRAAYADAQAWWRRAPTLPELYLHGRRDGCIALATASLGARSLPQGSRFEVIDDAGHFLHLEQPDHVNALIADFIAGSALSPRLTRGPGIVD